jgi:hypothetical protein
MRNPCVELQTSFFFGMYARECVFVVFKEQALSPIHQCEKKKGGTNEAEIERLPEFSGARRAYSFRKNETETAVPQRLQ